MDHLLTQERSKFQQLPLEYQHALNSLSSQSNQLRIDPQSRSGLETSVAVQIDG